jgi:hypothetical protein
MPVVSAESHGSTVIHPTAARSRLAVSLLGAILLVGACSAGVPATTEPTPAPAATPRITFPPRPTPLPTATPAPTPTPDPEPTPVANSTDLASSLKIGKPYRLVDNAANKALTGSFKLDMGGQHIEAAMNGREVWSGSSLVGAAIVMRFTGYPVTSAMFEGAARGGASNVNGKVSYATVLGTRVAYITSTQATAGMFVLHGAIVMVAGTTSATTKTLLASVIKANK